MGGTERTLMGRKWIDTVGPQDAEDRVEGYWTQMSADVQNDGFWYDQIREYRKDPDRRLAAALNELPLPAAFRESAIAIRSLIRAKRKAKEPYTSHLAFLYWLAAVESLMLPYATRLQQPGFNVMESIPGDRIKGLQFEYRTLGYKRLELLGVTDHKWLVEAWGEPEAHATLNEQQQNLWCEFEDRLIEKERKHRVKFDREIRALLRPEPPAKPAKPKGLLARLFSWL